MRRFAETAVLIVIALAMIGTWLVEPLEVVSGSMTPTLRGPHRAFDCPHCGVRNTLPADFRPMIGRPAYCEACREPGPIEGDLPIARGDKILVDRTAYVRRRPARWEVVAFRLPYEARKLAVKRILGLPGETITVRDGRWFADDQRLDPPATVAEDIAVPLSGEAGISSQWKLSGDEYFVVGDHAALSVDSRSWPTGPGVSSQLIIGKPFIVYLPARTARLFGRSIHVPDLARVRYIR